MATAFISYSRKDRRFVRKLSRDIEQLGVTVWLDEKNILAGESLPRSIRDGIDKSDHFVVVLSEASVSSEWVQREIDVASTIEIQTGKNKVIPVVRDAVHLPAMLEGKLFADFRERYQTGLAALRRALKIDEQLSPVMVGVLIGADGIPGVVKYLISVGYSPMDAWPSIVAVVEIVAGYFAHLRGGQTTRGGEFYVYQPQGILDISRTAPILSRDAVIVAFGFTRDDVYRALRESDPDFYRDSIFMPTRRNVLYVFGPAGEVRLAIQQLLRCTELPSGANADLGWALKWWESPVFLTNAGTVVVDRR